MGKEITATAQSPKNRWSIFPRAANCAPRKDKADSDRFTGEESLLEGRFVSATRFCDVLVFRNLT
jgi:hypothetical protein